MHDSPSRRPTCRLVNSAIFPVQLKHHVPVFEPNHADTLAKLTALQPLGAALRGRPDGIPQANPARASQLHYLVPAIISVETHCTVGRSLLCCRTTADHVGGACRRQGARMRDGVSASAAAGV